MSKITIHKVLNELPPSLKPDALYFVKIVGGSFDFYCTDNLGQVAHKLNNITQDELLNYVNLSDDQTIEGIKSFVEGINMEGSTINNVADPIYPKQAATKDYVDNKTLLIDGGNF